MAEIKRPRFRKSKTKKNWLVAGIIGILFSFLGLWVLMSLRPLPNKFLSFVGVFIEFFILLLTTAFFDAYRKAGTAEYDHYDTPIDFRLNELIPEYGVVERFIMEKRTKLKFSHVVIGKNGVFAIRVMSFPNCIIDTTSEYRWTLMPIINGKTFHIEKLYSPDNHVEENVYFTERFRSWCRERCDLYEYDEEDIFALTLFIDCIDINSRVKLPESGEPSVFFSKDALIDYIRGYKPHQEVSAQKINYLVNKFKEHKDK